MHEIIVLSDEEFYERKKQARRKDFLKELENMSKPSSSNSFSIKGLTNESDKKEKPKKEDDESISSFMAKESISEISDEEWKDFVGDLEGFELSPINTVTDERMIGFQLDEDVVEPDDNKYNKVFKKELAMLSEVLKDVKSHGNRVDAALKKMNIGGKGTSSRVTGIPKGYTDLVEAYNSISTTKIQVIKAMSDLRSKQIDWGMKEKARTSEESESADSIADNYYKRIIGGGTKNFIQSSMGQYQHSDFDFDPITDSQSSDAFNDVEGDPSTIDSLVLATGFNITQPIQGSHSYQNEDIEGDEFGYIANEKRDYEVCAYQYGDGKFQFGAIDQFGEPIDNVELPSDSDPYILESLQIRPGSDFVYDKYGRKYRIIEMGGVDISDIDDMDYPFDE